MLAQDSFYRGLTPEESANASGTTQHGSFEMKFHDMLRTGPVPTQSEALLLRGNCIRMQLSPFTLPFAVLGAHQTLHEH